MTYTYQTPELAIEVKRVIDAALAEDIGPGDITSNTVMPEDLHFSGAMVARHSLVLAGMDFARQVFNTIVPDASFTARAKDGDILKAGSIICSLQGPARGLLTAERTALNLMQHLSGIASATRNYVEKIEGTGCVLLDTRKTIPGLRLLEKYAAKVGGAENHRLGLYDGVLIKDNHIAVCGSLTQAITLCRKAGLPRIEAECDTLDQVKEAVAAGPDMILLDNMPPEMMRRAVEIVAGRCKLEASGGITLDTIRSVAETGVDFVSVGRITQSAPAADIGMDWS